ncbi:hypothetical protein GH714_014839 [Hevea brasiliensis]|uniref:Uncharacterized protein n=1 Tax=Hevea brasiliensis TaxID=3981 RepID=A0A6A6KNU2_HEVBR|nr:hypothetical protein GH714_014839 [Hevea brasiliensis]
MVRAQSLLIPFYLAQLCRERIAERIRALQELVPSANKVRKRDKARKKLGKKTNRKRKKKDDKAQCDSAGEDAQSQFHSAATKDNEFQLSPANSEVDQMQLVLAAGEGEG